MGNHGVVGPGGIQFMSAGTGVAHSEFNDSAGAPAAPRADVGASGQIGAPPSYGQMDFSVDQRRNRWLEVVSGEPGVDAPIRITQRATLRVARVEGTSIVAEFAPKRYGFLFVAEGRSRPTARRCWRATPSASTTSPGSPSADAAKWCCGIPRRWNHE